MSAKLLPVPASTLVVKARSNDDTDALLPPMIFGARDARALRHLDDKVFVARALLAARRLQLFEPLLRRVALRDPLSSRCSHRQLPLRVQPSLSSFAMDRAK
jgi:hypothetical protein